MALKDESIEYRLEQYNEKNMILDANGARVSARTMYEDIFPSLDMVMPIVRIDEDEEKHIVKMTIEEALERSSGRNDMLLGGSTYFNEFVSKATAKDIYAFIIDMDNVYAGILLLAFKNEWRRVHGEFAPLPTYIVNSGTGLHLYFVLDKPLPHLRRQWLAIDRLYRNLAKLETTGYNYLHKSVQWFGQDFRIAGGCGKDGWENTVYRVGEKWDADKLAAAVGVDFQFEYDADAAPPQIKKEKKGGTFQKRKGYYLNQRVYETSLERCRNETHEGNRYMSMCALSVLAWKCKVAEEQLRHDLLSLLPDYNKAGVTRLVKPKEIESAMKMYNELAIDTPRERTEDWLGWKFVGARRNGRKQAEHLRRARILQTADYPNGEWRNRKGRPLGTNSGGRPNGSGKKEIVKAWRDAHPDGKKIDCERETRLSRHTVLKWWNIKK